MRTWVPRCHVLCSWGGTTPQELEAGARRFSATMTSAARVALVIEDDPLVAGLAKEMLHELGYDVQIADSVWTAIATIDLAHPHIAILDANLKGVPAYRVARRLKDSGVPFVVATGFDPSRLPDEFGYGVPLRKPYSLAGLAEALDTASAPRWAADRREDIHLR